MRPIGSDETARARRSLGGRGKGLPIVAFSAVVLLFATLAAATEIPVMDFARAPKYALPALSPDGATLSFVRHIDHHDELIIRDLRDGSERAVLRFDARREHLGWCDWANEDFVICGTRTLRRQPTGVSEATRLYSLHTRTRQLIELNRGDGNAIRDHVIGTRRSDRGVQVLVQRDPRGTGFSEVVAVDPATAETRRELRSRPPIQRWMSDHQGRVRLGIAYDEDDVTLYTRSSAVDDWTVLAKHPVASMDALAPLAIGPEMLYVLKHHQGRAALFGVNLGEFVERDRGPELIFADPQYDITGPVALSEEGTLLGTYFVGEAAQYRALNESEAQIQAWLDDRLGASHAVLDRSVDGRQLLIEVSSDIDAPSLFVADSRARTILNIADAYPALERLKLAASQSVTYGARDGQKIPAYLTLPWDRRSSPHAFIVLPHGGPESRVWRRFDPLVQLLASRGFGVLQMNFRGSLGYGHRFAAAGGAQWGGVIHNDITDGARWLIEEQLADPTQLCIFGASFGGYAAMLGAMRESQWYACAVSYGGISDLLAFSQRKPKDITWRARLGEDPLALWQMSPIARVHTSETPVLLLHGLLDALVPASQSRRLARALRKAGKTHELVLRGDCDHEMTLESCRVAIYEQVERFLREQIHP